MSAVSVGWRKCLRLRDSLQRLIITRYFPTGIEQIFSPADVYETSLIYQVGINLTRGEIHLSEVDPVKVRMQSKTTTTKSDKIKNKKFVRGSLKCLRWYFLIIAGHLP